MGRLKKTDWKAVLGAVKEFIVSLGRGDLVLRMRVDRLFPYILWTFILGCVSIWMSYMTEQAMLKVEKNKDILTNLKIEHAHKTYETVSLDKLATVETLLQEMDSKVKPPQKPADILKK